MLQGREYQLRVQRRLLGLVIMGLPFFLLCCSTTAGRGDLMLAGLAHPLGTYAGTFIFIYIGVMPFDQFLCLLLGTAFVLLIFNPFVEGECRLLEVLYWIAAFFWVIIGVAGSCGGYA